MTFSGLISMLFAGFIKPMVSVVLSFCMTVVSLLSGPMGDYQALYLKPLSMDASHTSVQYEVSGNLGLISGLFGVDTSKDDAFKELGIDGLIDENGKLTVSGGYDLYLDLGKARIALELAAPEGKSYGIYLDPTAFAVSADLTRDVITLEGLIGEQYGNAYAKHTDGYGFYFDFDEYFASFVAENMSEAKLKTTQGICVATLEAYNDIFTSLSGTEGMALIKELIDINKATSESFFSESAVDGVKAYTYKVSVKELLEAVVASADIVKSEEYLTLSNQLMDMVLGAIDYTDIVKAIALSEGASENELKAYAEAKGTEFANQLRKQHEEAYEKSLSGSADLLKAYAGALLTGEGLSEIFGEDKATAVTLLLPILHGTTVTDTLYEKDGKIYEDYLLTIGAGEAELISVKYKAVTEDYKGAIKTPAEAVPFGSRLTLDVMANKVGFESAKTKGVNAIMVEWDSEMAPTSTAPAIYEPVFYVRYNTKIWDVIDADKSLSDEDKAFMKNYFDKDEPEYITVSSSVELIDSSAYLPLRQLMENAGLEVSWDAEARKAYVTVGENKIEMTGTIVNNKTYVKIRDFEKLGAKVEYEETIYHANDWNDFSKTCYATIRFEEK